MISKYTVLYFGITYQVCAVNSYTVQILLVQISINHLQCDSGGWRANDACTCVPEITGCLLHVHINSIWFDLKSTYSISIGKLNYNWHMKIILRKSHYCHSFICASHFIQEIMQLLLDWVVMLWMTGKEETNYLFVKS